MPGGTDIRTFYRILAGPVPTLDDFLSQKARGRRPPVRPELLRVYDGVSVYDTQEAAVATARYFWPKIGRWVAALQVPKDGPIQVEKTLADPHHFTLWASPRALLERVELSSVKAIEPAESAG